jgi:predicted flap endonuclease-1-like 5' DNA nuclease
MKNKLKNFLTLKISPRLKQKVEEEKLKDNLKNIQGIGN